MIVKRLASIHDLGAMDVLCTDKTGTLTEAKISLLARIGADGRDCPRVLALAGVNSRFESGIRSPLDAAIVEQCASESLEGWTKIDEVPFDFERRRVSVLAEKDGERILIIKGAPETVLARATLSDPGDGRALPLDAPSRENIERVQDTQSACGYRLLAVAWKAMPAQLHAAAARRRTRSGPGRLLRLCRSTQAERDKRRCAARSRGCPCQGRFR